jgi:uncharacterized damage-inducible protein DinB
MTTAAPSAEALAQQFLKISAVLIDTAEQCSPEQWQKQTDSERWPVAVVAHHVSEVEEFFAGVLTGAISDMALTSAFVDENNARHAAEHANANQAETVAALRANGEALARAIGSLSEADLRAPSMSIDGQQLTKEQIIQFGVNNHFQEHLASIRAAIGE